MSTSDWWAAAGDFYADLDDGGVVGAGRARGKGQMNGEADGIWRTASGEEIPYEKLEDAHLVNVLGHLRLRAIRDRLLAINALLNYRPGGDGAAMACEEAMDGFLQEEFPEDFGLPPRKESDPRPWESYVNRPLWDALMAEARRRSLKIVWTVDEDGVAFSGGKA